MEKTKNTDLEKAILEAEGLFRSNIEKAWQDFQNLCNQISNPKMDSKLVARFEKKGKFPTCQFAVKWNPGIPKSDVSEKTVLGTDTPDMFDKDDKDQTPIAKRKPFNKKPTGEFITSYAPEAGLKTEGK